MVNKALNIILFVVLIPFLASCSSSENSTSGGTGAATVAMSDMSQPAAIRGRFELSQDGCESSIDFFTVEDRNAFSYSNGEYNVIGELVIRWGPMVHNEVRGTTTSYGIAFDIETNNGMSSCSGFVEEFFVSETMEAQLLIHNIPPSPEDYRIVDGVTSRIVAAGTRVN